MPLELSNLPPHHADLLAANLAALERRFETTFTWTREDLARVRVEQVQGLAAGGWTASLDTGTDWTRLHSARRPLEEAQAQVRQALGQSPGPRTIAAVGHGLGYVLDVLEPQVPEAKFLVIEPFAGLIPWFLARRDWRPLIAEGRLLVLAGPDFGARGDAWRLVDQTAEPVVIVNAVVARLSPAVVDAARRIVEHAVSGARQNEDARRRFAGPYLSNTLQNLPALARERPVRDWFDTCPGVPAIVAAAGPSLDGNIEEVRQCRGAAVLIAVDTALRPLLMAGLQPDFVVAVDPGEANARTLIDIPDCPDTRLIAEPSLAPAVFRRFTGRTWLFRVAEHAPWPWLLDGGIDPGLLRAWGSVLVTAFDFAVRLGCDPIGIVGADLGYSREQPYCRETVYEGDWRAEVEAGKPLSQVWQERTKNGTICVNDINGQPVRTSAAMIAFRDAVVQAAGRLKNRRVINATGAGILDGAPMTLGRLSTGTAKPGGSVRLKEPPAEAGHPQLPVMIANLLEAIYRGEPCPWDSLGLQVDSPRLIERSAAVLARGFPASSAPQARDADQPSDLTGSGGGPLDVLHRLSNERGYRSDAEGRRLFLAALAEYQGVLAENPHPTVAGQACDRLVRWAWYTSGSDREVVDATAAFVEFTRRWFRRAVQPRDGRRRADRLTIGYLACSHMLTPFDPRAWLTWSLLKGHAESGADDLRIRHYALDTPSQGLADAVRALGIEFRQPGAGLDGPSAFAAVRGALATDAVDVLVSPSRDAFTAALFAARSARLQVLLDVGVPWYATSADACFRFSADTLPPYDTRGARQVIDDAIETPLARLCPGLVFGYIGRYSSLATDDLANITDVVSKRPGAMFYACAVGDPSPLVEAFSAAGLSAGLVVDNVKANFTRALERIDVAIVPDRLAHDFIHPILGAAGTPIWHSSTLAAVPPEHDERNGVVTRTSLPGVAGPFATRREPGGAARRLEAFIRAQWAARVR